MAEVTEATVLAGVREELEQLKVPGAAEATMDTEWRDLDIDSLELVELGRRGAAVGHWKAQDCLWSEFPNPSFVQG